MSALLLLHLQLLLLLLLPLVQLTVLAVPARESNLTSAVLPRRGCFAFSATTAWGGHLIAAAVTAGAGAAAAAAIR